MTKIISTILICANGITAIENVDHFFPFMDYRTITDKSSIQYQIQSQSTTNDEGFRVYNNRYCVALHSSKFKLEEEYILKFGDSEYKVIVSDLRPTSNTENTVEFIVGVDKLSTQIKTTGSVLNVQKEGDAKNE